MKVVFGLGNPGKHYRHTPHNVGFAVIDKLASRLSCVLKKGFRFKARIGRAILNEEELLLVRPETYMNRSGVAAASILRHWGLTPLDMIVVLDDADLAIGQLRIRVKGSSGGHRGLESIIRAMEGDEFTRVRIGIGRDSGGGGLKEHVLTPFSSGEWQDMEKAVKHAVEAVICILESGTETAMNRFNRRDHIKCGLQNATSGL